MTLGKIELFLFFAAFTTFADYSLSAPAPASPAKSEDRVLNSTVPKVSPSAVVSTTLVKEEKDDGLRKGKETARDCTLEALRIILSNEKRKLTEECRDILVRMTENAGKQKDQMISNEIDLRQELQDLAEKEGRYDAMNDEIENAESLLAEKRFSGEKTEISKGAIEPGMLLQAGSDKRDSNYVESNGNRYSETPVRRQSAELSQKYGFSPSLDGRRHKQEREDFRDSNLVDEAQVGKIKNSDGREGNFDDDYLVIPMRFLRKHMLLDGKPNEDITQDRRVTAPRKMADDTRWYNDNDAAKWLLQAILATELDQGSLANSDGLQDTNNPGKTTKNTSETKTQAKHARAFRLQDEKDEDKERDNNSNTQKKDDVEVNREMLSRVQNDIVNLGRDLRQLPFGNIH